MLVVIVGGGVVVDRVQIFLLGKRIRVKFDKIGRIFGGKDFVLVFL